MTNEHSEKQYAKSIDIRASNRPAKVAFIVPLDENAITHWILDGIFYEAYSRWGGSKSLIIPFTENELIKPEYVNWLAKYDPDFVYSYVDLSEQQIGIINKSSLPINIIRHDIYGDIERWRQFIPKWPYGFTPIKSISTINSPYAKYQGWSEQPQQNLYITQHYPVDEHRFLPDNFGVSHDVDCATYGRSNSFGTISYCSNDIPENIVVGNVRCHNLIDYLHKLSTKQVKTFLQLSSIHASGVNHPTEYLWNNAFHVFVGNAVSDRLNFWNSRLISNNSYQHEFNSLCISIEQASDEEFCKALGGFLNSHNFKGHGGGPNSVHIRSLSTSKDMCLEIGEKINLHTWNYVSVPDSFSQSAIPSERCLSEFYSGGGGLQNSLLRCMRTNISLLWKNLNTINTYLLIYMILKKVNV